MTLATTTYRLSPSSHDRIRPVALRLRNICIEFPSSNAMLHSFDCHLLAGLGGAQLEYWPNPFSAPALPAASTAATCSSVRRKSPALTYSCRVKE